MAGQNVLRNSSVRRAALGIALAFAAIAGLGYFAYPRLAAIWLVPVVFAVATLARVTKWSEALHAMWTSGTAELRVHTTGGHRRPRGKSATMDHAGGDQP